MATRVAWLLNLDADMELAAPERHRASPELAARIRALIPQMGMLLRPDDIILDVSMAPPPHVPALAFCPTPSAQRKLKALGLVPFVDVPLTLLRKVNDRAFSAELGQTLPHAAFVRDMEGLERAIRAPSPYRVFVLKRAFGFAGRERREARDGELDASTRGFATRSFARGEGLQVEPWLERRGDFARHGWVTRKKTLLLGPTVLQRCDARGRWLGSEEAPPDALRRDEADHLEGELVRTGQALAQLGYVGPFGIDAFRYLDASGTLCFQPRSEINARFTMGFPRAILDRALASE